MAGRMQDQLVAGAQQSLLEASHAARRAADPQSFMVDAFTEIVEAYGRESALAARDYAVADYVARGARVSPGQIELSAPVFEQADSSARWAVFGAGDAFEGEALHRLQGVDTSCAAAVSGYGAERSARSWAVHSHGGGARAWGGVGRLLAEVGVPVRGLRVRGIGAVHEGRETLPRSL